MNEFYAIFANILSQIYIKDLYVYCFKISLRSKQIEFSSAEALYPVEHIIVTCQIQIVVNDHKTVLGHLFQKQRVILSIDSTWMNSME